MADMKELTGSTYFPAEGQSFRNYIEELLKAKPKFSGLFTQQSPVQPISAGTTQAGTAITAPQSSSAPFGYDSQGNRRTSPDLSPEQKAYFDWLEANPGYKDERGAAMSGAIGALTNLLPGAALLNKAAGVNPFSGLSGLFDTERSLWNQFQIDQARQDSGQVFDGAARSLRSGYTPEQSIVGGLMSDYMPAVNQAIMDPRDAMVAAPVATSYPVSSGGNYYNPTQESVNLAVQMANEAPQYSENSDGSYSFGGD